MPSGKESALEGRAVRRKEDDEGIGKAKDGIPRVWSPGALHLSSGKIATSVLHVHTYAATSTDAYIRVCLHELRYLYARWLPLRPDV